MPQCTVPGLPVFTIERSAEVLTVVVAVPVLFVVFGSNVAEVTVAELDRFAVWPGSTATTSVISGALVTANDGRVQVTVLVPEQVQPDPVAETKLVPAGNASETESDAAFDGPAFETDNV